jgi:hypothetical protein
VAPEQPAVEGGVLAAPVRVEVALLHDQRAHAVLAGQRDDPLQRRRRNLAGVELDELLPGAVDGDVVHRGRRVVRGPGEERPVAHPRSTTTGVRQ